MPQPPGVNLFTRYVLENPWPGVIVFLIAAIGFGWSAMRQGHSRRLQAAIGLAVVAVVLFMADWLVVTAGERARQVVRTLAEAAAAEDIIVAMNQFADTATIGLASTANPRMDIDAIRVQLDRLVTRYQVKSNALTRLKAYTTSSQSATVHLDCRTELDESPYPIATEWVIEVRRQEDGTWKITDLTWISISGNPPEQWW